ncbi:MAG: helix-turn-helix transcriptional regulator [Bacteroidia bacterium]|nr:helix-turn-helix transcriptional regulator [Bacteroidia bacterium]
MYTETKEDIREKILYTAQTMFIRYGIRSVTMNDIAKELGISKKPFISILKIKMRLYSWLPK